MIRGLLGLVAAIAFGGALVCLYLARPTPAPGLWTANPVLDRGALSQGQEVHATFELVNNYQQPLEIMDVIKECRCSEAVLTTKKLDPGDRTELKVVWNTGAMRGRSGVNLSVVYKLPHAAVRHAGLRVEGDVLPDIVYTPEKVTFAGNKAETQTVRLAPGRMKEFTIQKVHCNHAAFKAQLRSRDVVEISFDPKVPIYANGLEPQLIVHCDSKNEPQLSIRLVLSTPLPLQ